MSLNTGSIHVAYTAGTYTVPSSPTLMLLVCDTTGGPIVLNFPSSASVPLAAVEVKKKNLGTNGITLNGATVGGVVDRIEGVTSYVMATANRGAVSLRSDGAGAWWAVPYAQPLPSDVVMLPAASSPTLTTSTGLANATVSLVAGSTDSRGTIVVTATVALTALTGQTITVTFANAAAFGSVPPVASLAANNSAAAGILSSAYAACPNTTTMVVTLPTLTMPLNGSLMLGYRCDGVAAN